MLKWYNPRLTCLAADVDMAFSNTFKLIPKYHTFRYQVDCGASNNLVTFTTYSGLVATVGQVSKLVIQSQFSVKVFRPGQTLYAIPANM